MLLRPPSSPSPARPAPSADARPSWRGFTPWLTARPSGARACVSRSVSFPPHELDALPARPATDPAWRDLRPVLDEEVSRLPDKYRATFVLCHVEGRTNEEAARELGCPMGTVLSRLGEARQRLRDRLTRRGVTLGVLATVLAGETATAAAPNALVLASVRAAAWPRRGRVWLGSFQPKWSPFQKEW